MVHSESAEGRALPCLISSRAIRIAASHESFCLDDALYEGLQEVVTYRLRVSLREIEAGPEFASG